MIQQQGEPTTVLLVPVPGSPDNGYTNLKYRRAIRLITIAQLILSVLILVLGISALAAGGGGNLRVSYRGTNYDGSEYKSYTRIMHGLDGSSLWGGVFMILTAAIGLAGALSKSKCLIISYLVLDIIAIVFSTVVFSMGIVWASVVASAIANNYYYEINNMDHAKAITAFYGVIATMAIIYLVIGIVASAFVCCTCCRSNKNGPTAYYVQGQALPTQQGPAQFSSNNGLRFQNRCFIWAKHILGALRLVADRLWLQRE